MNQIQSLSKQASKQVEVIGCMDHTMDNTFESANRVYDVNGVAPTMNTCGGGGLQPKILEVKKLDVNELGFIEHGTGKHQSNTVFGTDGVSPTVTTVQGGGTQQIKICDVKQLGHLEKGTGAHQSNIVYDENGLSPCICAGMGVKQQPTMIVDAQSLRMVRTEEGKAIRKAYESGEVHHGFNEFRTAEPREDGVSNTITTVLKDNMILEQCIVAMRGRNPGNPSDRTPGIDLEQRLEVNSEGICNTLTSVQKDNLVLEVRKEIDPKYHNFIYEIDGELYLIRIRKLIPRECWRLMSFTDEDFDKAASVNSNTQLYKQAGNSIVKDVMMAIFRQML